MPVTDRLARLPFWLLGVLLIAVFAFWTIITNSDYRVIFSAVRKGVGTTIYVSMMAYSASLLFGLVWCLMRVSTSRLLQEISSFYVEIIRGVPMLVLLYFISFVGAPALVTALNWVGKPLIEAGYSLKSMSAR